jgi:thiol-disulfide isomerase/thioredoxin
VVVELTFTVKQQQQAVQPAHLSNPDESEPPLHYLPCSPTPQDWSTMRQELRLASFGLLVFVAGRAVDGFQVAQQHHDRGSAGRTTASRRRHTTLFLATTSNDGGSTGDSSSLDTIPPPAAFGQVVRRKPFNTTLHGSSTSGDSAASVDLLFSSSSTIASSPSLSSPASSPGAAAESAALPSLEAIRRRNTVTAVAAVVLAVGNYLWQFTHPHNPLQLLAQMQASSSDLSVIGTNGRPTLVDFWAPFCENCKLEAATLEQIHQKYAGRVNFVMVNGDDPSPKSWEAIDAFGVDVVPHMALVNSDGEVETALVGIIPQHVIEADLDTLLGDTGGSSNDGGAVTHSPLPYTMLDTFASRPEQRKLHFDPNRE